MSILVEEMTQAEFLRAWNGALFGLDSATDDLVERGLDPKVTPELRVEVSRFMLVFLELFLQKRTKKPYFTPFVKPLDGGTALLDWARVTNRSLNLHIYVTDSGKWRYERHYGKRSARGLVRDKQDLIELWEWLWKHE